MLYIILLIMFVLVSMTFSNKYLPRIFCDKVGWHLHPHNTDFDGVNWIGICPRCGKRVMQDSRGNWKK